MRHVTYSTAHTLPFKRLGSVRFYTVLKSLKIYLKIKYILKYYLFM